MIAATADKASPNQRFVEMLGKSTTNLFAPQRKIYLISDPPHLVKTARNNLANSGSGLRSRYLWVRHIYTLLENLDVMGHEYLTEDLLRILAMG